MHLDVDTAKTMEFYKSQNKIVDDCTCDDCNFYATIFIKEKLEIFSLLQSMGVDLEKNLISEPTGVWCIRDDNGNLLHCQQIFQVVGQLSIKNSSKLRFENTEFGFGVATTFAQADGDKIDIEVLIDKL